MMEETGQMDQENPVHKEATLQRIHGGRSSAVQKYQDFFVGSRASGDLIKFEIATTLLRPFPGAAGYLLRKWFYPRIFRSVGEDVNWGRNIALRHPGRIEIGDRTAIDDDCLLDASGTGDKWLQIGNDVLVARSTNIQGKTSWIEIGDHCNIASHCQIISATGIRFGKWVMVGGQCYIGGGRYRIDDRDTPMMKQEVYSKGPVIIEDDVWIGAGVIVQDGVHIGRGSVIGAGAVIREDVSEYTVIAPHSRLIMLPRD
jgi:acetyltransferase-like isoleucine patch superfamily enzyme